MKISHSAAQQMYPHLGNTTCDEHGVCPRAKVPSKLLSVFADTDNPGWACAGCVLEAREKHDEAAKETKRQLVQAKAAQREAIKVARESAKNADKALDEYVTACQNAVVAVKIAERDIDSTQSKITSSKNKVTGALQRLEKAKSDYEAHQDAFIQLVDLKDEQFETLDNADSDVALCYNVLQDKLDEANSLWDALGKAAKKKRDKGNRKSAVVLLRRREELDEKTRSGERSPEELQDDGEQEDS